MIFKVFDRNEVAMYCFYISEMFSGVIIYYESIYIAENTASAAIYYVMWLTLIAGFTYIIHGIFGMVKILDRYSPLREKNSCVEAARKN